MFLPFYSKHFFTYYSSSFNVHGNKDQSNTNLFYFLEVLVFLLFFFFVINHRFSRSHGEIWESYRFFFLSITHSASGRRKPRFVTEFEILEVESAANIRRAKGSVSRFNVCPKDKRESNLIERPCSSRPVDAVNEAKSKQSDSIITVDSGFAFM